MLAEVYARVGRQLFRRALDNARVIEERAVGAPIREIPKTLLPRDLAVARGHRARGGSHCHFPLAVTFFLQLVPIVAVQPIRFTIELEPVHWFQFRWILKSDEVTSLDPTRIDLRQPTSRQSTTRHRSSSSESNLFFLFE